MIAPAIAPTVSQGVFSAVLFALTMLAAAVGLRPLGQVLLWRERQFDHVLRRQLLLDINPRSATVASVVFVLLCGAFGYLVVESVVGVLLFAAGAAVAPSLVLRLLRARRVKKLESQLVEGIHTLASGVRAGLNLVQSLELVSRDGPVPLRQEFAHLLREYEYGMPLEEAMENAAARIGSSDFRLLFSALQTHRERGGDLADTLDRIAGSIREIQRLESRVEALTAEGRVTARVLAAFPAVVLGILYFIDAAPVAMLFTDTLGKVILTVIVVLNVLSFLWIRRIVAIDI
ncbi:MAG: type II secretion system F family protein [Planctomycetota bacterium]